MDDQGRFGQDEDWREINFASRERHAADVERRGREAWRSMPTAALAALCATMPPCLQRLALANYCEVRWSQEDAGGRRGGVPAPCCRLTAFPSG